MEAPPAREQHRCCCVFVSTSGDEDACQQMADADNPVCVDCEVAGHHEPGFSEKALSSGVKVVMRIPTKERK